MIKFMYEDEIETKNRQKNTESAERQNASFPNHKVKNLDLPNSILN